MGPAEKVAKVERFYLRELSRYLRAREVDVAKFLSGRHLLQRQTFAARHPTRWTSARGVALAVAHFRAIQGRKYEQGKDPIGQLDRQRELSRRQG